MSYFIQCAYDLAGLLLGALAVIAALKGVGRLLRLVWLPEPVREGIERVGPLLGLVAVLAYLAFGFLLIFEREEHFAWVILGVTTLCIAFAWSPLYDLVCGAAFRASRVCRLGDLVQVGKVEGRVIRLGTRVLVVRTHGGDEAVLYYGRIVRDAFRRTQSLTGAHVHSFRTPAPKPEALAEFRQRVRRAALRCHWSSVVHAPRVEPASDEEVEISVFALHRDYAPVVESAVRRAISEAAPPNAPRAALGAALPSTRSGRVVPPPTPG